MLDLNGLLLAFSKQDALINAFLDSQQQLGLFWFRHN